MLNLVASTLITYLLILFDLIVIENLVTKLYLCTNTVLSNLF